jgi:hypothetical protein
MNGQITEGIVRPFHVNSTKFVIGVARRLSIVLARVEIRQENILLPIHDSSKMLMQMCLLSTSSTYMIIIFKSKNGALTINDTSY